MHFIKENSNASNINKTVQPKIGVFFNKDQKMIALEKENQEMQILLNAQMNIFNELNKNHHDLQSQKSRVLNQNSLIEVESMMLQQSILKLEAKLNLTNPQVVQKQMKVSQLNTQLNKIQQNLTSLMVEGQQSKNVIKRYKQQLKLEKQMVRSDKNVNNICQSLRKNHENYLKNITILQNKLQSKKKYLQILLKKQSQQKKEHQDNINQKQISSKSQNQKNSSQKRLHEHKFTQNKSYCQVTNQKSQSKNMKGFNELIRKKNAILARNK